MDKWPRGEKGVIKYGAGFSGLPRCVYSILHELSFQKLLSPDFPFVKKTIYNAHLARKVLWKWLWKCLHKNTKLRSRLMPSWNIMPEMREKKTQTKLYLKSFTNFFKMTTLLLTWYPFSKHSFGKKSWKMFCRRKRSGSYEKILLWIYGFFIDY